AVNTKGSAEAGPPTRLLLSHGSRRSGGNQGAVALAAGLQAAIAYWSVAPSLIEKVESLVQLGQRQLVLLPYFLFPGGITDAIAQQMSELRQTHPGLHIYLAPLLSHSPGFPELVASLMQSAAMPHRPTTLTS
ncbi:MAG: CbiX/SirB N-terminal domain-containing protein, partial [Cyanobacteria bacterium P01_A01_bin.135]